MTHEEKLQALNALGIKFISRGENIEILEGDMPTETEIQAALNMEKVADIDAQVVAKSENGTMKTKNIKYYDLELKTHQPDFIAYDIYAEECRAWGQAEKRD